MHHHRSDYDFDVISGPATPPPPRATPAPPAPGAGGSAAAGFADAAARVAGNGSHPTDRAAGEHRDGSAARRHP